MILAMIFYVIANILTAVLFFAIDYLVNKGSPTADRFATSFQKCFRGYLTKKHKASTSIQKRFRGYITRKAYLPVSLFPRYVSECKKTAAPDYLPIEMAPNGNTPVYLPSGLPEVILKKSGRKQAIKRFHQMQWVRAVLRKQNSSHLIIPKARLCGEFLVEQRVPIFSVRSDNTYLYRTKPELFNEAVIELVRFSSRAYIGDLVSFFQDDPDCYTSAGKHLLVRYDNIPLYLEGEKGKEKGKIGLIDLEQARPFPSIKGLETLIQIFPLHFSIIKKEAMKLGLFWNDIYLSALSKRRIEYMQDLV